jgi:hypothetical protein
MGTALFTDLNLVVFAITISAVALIISVGGLATTGRVRSDIQRELNRLH